MMSCRLKSRKRKSIRAALPQVCVRCGATEGLTLDHIIPRVYGGTNERSNFQILCLPCNHLKSRNEVRHWNPKKNQLKAQLLVAALDQPRLACAQITRIAEPLVNCGAKLIIWGPLRKRKK